MNNKRKVLKVAIYLIGVIIFTVITINIFNQINDKPSQSNNESGVTTFGKPVIYLYPKSEQEVSVKLDYKGELICTYPEYKEGWRVIAKPDGTLKNLRGNKEYSYLFWEGKSKEAKWDLSKGFIVKGEDTEEFLQDKLSKLGLNPKEYNEFIVYWMPLMKSNKYNFITFAGKEYEEVAKLEVSPKPDSILRIFMVYKALDKPIKIAKQEINSFHRQGFTVVEWGGTEIK